MKWKFIGNKLRHGGKTYYNGHVFNEKPSDNEAVADLFVQVEEEKKTKAKSSGGKSGGSKSSGPSTSNTGNESGGNDEGTGKE